MQAPSLKTVVQAVKSTMLVYASIHLIVLILYAIINRDISPINSINLLGLSLFKPDMPIDTTTYFISGAGMLIVFSGCYVLARRKKQPQSSAQ